MLLHHVDSWRDSGPKSRKKNFGSSFRSLAMFHFPPSFPPRLSPHKGLQPEVSSVLQSGFWEVVFNPSKHTTRVSDGGWRVTDGGWWATHGGWRVTFSVTEGLVCVFCSPCRRPRAVVVDQRGPREGNPPNPPNSPSRPLTAPRIDTHTHPFAHALTPCVMASARDGGWGGGGSISLVGGATERGSFGRAVVKALCLPVACLQRVTQGLGLLGIGRSVDRCHSRTIAVIVFVPHRCFEVFWASNGRETRSRGNPKGPPFGKGVCEKKGLWWRPSRRAPAKRGGGLGKGAPCPSPPPPQRDRLTPDLSHREPSMTPAAGPAGGTPARRPARPCDSGTPKGLGNGGRGSGGGEGGWHKASVSDCLPLAAPIGPSPLHILTRR